MNTPLLGRLALTVGAAALLSACGGSSVPIGGPSSAAASVQAPKGAMTFHYIGREQSFVVPKGVRQISVVMRGAAGGGEFFGRGGRVHGIIRVRPGDILRVFVGGQGNRTETGGFNGGGTPGYGRYDSADSYGGGGASDVRERSEQLHDRILVAAGGGGQGSSPDEVGGSGGGEIGGAGESYCYGGSPCIAGDGGNGGTQSQGGSGGAGGQSYKPGQPGSAGTLGNGGNGGTAGCAYLKSGCYCVNANGCPGAGGGGGYYGGGGGGGGGASGQHAASSGGSGGGGGGGSTWASSGVADFRTWAGWKNATGDGLVVFSW